MFQSRFTSRAHPLGNVALDGPAAAETDGLTDAEKAAIGQIAGVVGSSVASQFGPRPAPEPEPAMRSSWILVGGVAAVVVVVALLWRRKG